MSPPNHFRDLLAQDTPTGNDGDVPGIAQPLSQAEIEELLYGDEWPAEERLNRLRDLREELRGMEAVDFGDEDPKSLMAEINDAIARLSDARGEGMDPVSVDHNPEDHRETLSPDSDELDAIEEEDEASVEDDIGEVLDEEEWEKDGDGFDTQRGVR